MKKSQPEIFTKKHLNSYLRAQWLNKDENISENERLGIDVEELIRISEQRNSSIDAPFLDLWIAILDELNSWLISLLSTIHRPSLNDTMMNEFERSVIVIIAKLISDTTSLRHLVTLGFDSSARTILRSILEYIQVLIAIVDDPALATEFVTAETPETANAFYFRQIARGKLHKRLETAWSRFFKSKDEAALFFANQQRELGQLLSGTAHPSFAGGYLAIIGFIQKDPNENWLGHWGAKSNMSISTISIYTTCFIPLLLISDFPFEGYDSWFEHPITYDISNEMHRHVKIGRTVLGSLILSLGKKTNIPHIFPDGFEPDAIDE